MASLADYAPAQAGESHGPSPRIAALLTLLAPGLGHIYIGQARRGITLFALVLVADILLMFSCLLYTSPSPRDRQKSRMPSSA